MTLFVDETALVALNSQMAPQHAEATEFVRSLLNETVQVVTSPIAVALAASELKEKGGAEMAKHFIELMKDGGVKVFQDTKEIYALAESLFLQSEHMVDVSYIDCMHVAFMQHYQITKIFTFKEHMNQMNVLVIPKR